MANCPNRCPRCGRVRRVANTATTPVADCTATSTVSSQLYNTATTPVTDCMATSTVSSQLYNDTTTEQPVFVTCCDSLYGCRVYNCSNRCRFWPSFCHPRWLTCNQLYSCRM